LKKAKGKDKVKGEIYDKAYSVFCQDCRHEIRRVPFLIRDNAEELASYHKAKTGHLTEIVVRKWDF
jgi:hypothetical protein